MSTQIDYVAAGLARLTSEYQGQPKLAAYLTALLQPLNNIEQAGQDIERSFDIDTAVGVQLDRIGDLVGIGRLVENADPLPFFGFEDTPNAGVYGEVRTNFLRNSTMQGASTGTPGALPTTWVGTNAAGVQSQVVAIGTESGERFIDLRFFGTPAATALPECLVRLEDIAAVPALAGQDWTSAFSSRVVGGSLAGVANCENFIIGYSSAGNVTDAGSRTYSATADRGRYVWSLTLSNAATAFVVARFDLNLSPGGGVPVDVTIRLTAPQLERGRYATPFLPTSSEPVAAPAGDVNWLRNSSMQGVILGVANLPIPWQFGATTDILPVPVEVGAYDGLDYIDLRFAGTLGSAIVRWELTTFVPAAVGRSWTNSAYLQLVAGSLLNVSSVSIGMSEHGAGGTQLAFGDTPTVLTGALARSSSTRTLSNSGTVFVSPRLTLAGTGAVDFTIRIAAPQLQPGSVATAPIRTTGAPGIDPSGERLYELGEVRSTALRLDDVTYRKFLRARIKRNHSTGTVEDFIAVLQYIFPNDGIIVDEGELVVQLSVDRSTTLLEEAVLTSRDLMPKAAGVQLIRIPYQLLINYFGFSPTGAVYGDLNFPDRGGPIAEERY